jgi:HEAT repeat protein
MPFHANFAARFRSPLQLRRVLLACATLAILNSLALATERLAPFDKAQWIWAPEAVRICSLRKELVLPEAPTAAHVLITADNGFTLLVNGSAAGHALGFGAEIWKKVKRYDIKSALTAGKNVIGIRGEDLGPPAGVIAAVRLEFKTAPPLEFVTDASWHVTVSPDPTEFAHPEYIEGREWHNPKVIGTNGIEPWGKLAYKPGGVMATPPEKIETVEPGKDFVWPQTIAFLGDDCSVYVPLRGDAWGVAFRVGTWSRAYTEFDLPCPSKIGRKLYALKPGPSAQPTLLLDAGTGCIGSPSAAFDGQSILLALAQAGDSFFHIQRLPAAGGTAKQLTFGPFHDIDPVELPDGRIAFTSTRTGTFEEYHSPPSRALFVMNADGSDIHPITSTIIFDSEPKVTADGRLAFVRTDNFFDRGKVETMIHTVRPDGTDGQTELGANVGADYGSRLRAFGYGSPAPLPDGRLACISNRGNVIAAPGGAEADSQRLPGNLGDLAPLPDGRLLCTVFSAAAKRQGSDTIGVIDPRDGKIVSVYRASSGAVHSPIFLGPRTRPPVVAESVDRASADGIDATGFLFCQDARFTTKSKADWPQIKGIRVLRGIGLTTRSSHSHIVHAGNQTEELGVVPIAPDGSFFVEVPADAPLALQAVDAEGRSELNEMSWIYVRPGECRSCVGCHAPCQDTPPASRNAQALRLPAVRLLGQGSPPHFRGNNSGVTGLMDLQFERFREIASLNRHSNDALTTGRQELAALVEQLHGAEPQKLSAIQRLGILRDHSAAPGLAERLRDESREVRVAAGMALSACGTRDSVPALLQALTDSDPVVAQSVATALESLTAHTPEFDAFAAPEIRAQQAAECTTWFGANGWPSIESALIAQLVSADAGEKRRAILALGHVGGDAGRIALQKFVSAESAASPYAPFEKNNRTDRFTFNAASPLNPRTLQTAVRALGQLKHADSLPLLNALIERNIEPASGNLFLAEAALEAVGRIGTPEAEATLIATFGKLKEYVQYVGWYSDHPALYACHASPLHARIVEALDALGSTTTREIVPQLIRSVPTDPDRALFPENDDYEKLVGRVIRRSGRGADTIETCLALLGDSSAVASDDVKKAVETTVSAWGGHPGPENRAAQILSLTSRDRKDEPRIRAAFERFRDRPEELVARALGNPTWTPVRHWTLFYLARALGNLGDTASVDTLLSVLGPNLNEARHGRPDPSTPEIHFLQLEYTPCWRAAVAYALGCIGPVPGKAGERIVPTLLDVVRNLDNATDVRHAAADALGRVADRAQVDALRKLAHDYPEVSTRKALLHACALAAKR